MKDKVIVRVIRLKACIIGENKTEKENQLMSINNNVWKAANEIINGQFLNDELINKIKSRSNKTNNKAEIEKKFKEVFGTKPDATTERDIKARFPELPSCVTNSLNRIVTSYYKKDRKNVSQGLRSVRSYKKGMPIPVAKQSAKFYENNNKYFFKLTIARNEHIEFKIILGKDKINHCLTLKKILSNKIDYCIPNIQIKNKSIYLIIPVKDPVKTKPLDPSLSVGVDLGISIPAYLGLSKGTIKKRIGSIDDFFKVRLQFQNRLSQLQKRLVSTNGGRGRKKKLKALGQLKEKEANFARSYNHFLSREIIRFALKQNAGVIKLEMLEGFGSRNKKDFILRNWAYFSLQKFISYKAEQVGIKVVKVDPYHTSQTCSLCGHYEKKQRINQSTFICNKCGATLNADYNAAVNIAKSKKIVDRKEQCQFYIQQRRRWDSNKVYPAMAKAG